MSHTIVSVENAICIDLRAREWCKLPYYNHPKGCPNFNSKETCPPTVGLVYDIFDFDKNLWFVIEQFDLKAHKIKMKNSHPDWSNKQCGCVLYWQGSVKKRLNERVKQFIFMGNGNISTDCPEAMGVNVFKTFRKLGLRMKRNPDVVNKVALIGYSKYANRRRPL